jgi:hypothetical protein
MDAKKRPILWCGPGTSRARGPRSRWQARGRCGRRCAAWPPSGWATKARRRRVSPRRSAWAPRGVLQSPPRAMSTPRSAATQEAVWVSWRRARTARVSASSARHSMPRAPWPTAGSDTSGSRICVARPSRPRRTRPARASTMASHSPASTLRRRVSTLPRSGTTSRSGRRALRATMRRRLDVPTRAPSGQPVEREVARGHEDIPGVFAPRDARDHEPFGESAGHVLDGVDGEVRPPVEEGLFDLLHEESLAADVRQRAVRDAVAAGHHLELARLEGGLQAAEMRDEGPALGERQHRFSRGVDEGPHGDEGACERTIVPPPCLRPLHGIRGGDPP